MLEDVDGRLSANPEVHTVRVGRGSLDTPLRYYQYVAPQQRMLAEPSGALLRRDHTATCPRSTFTHVRESEPCIRDYPTRHNQKPKPFVWTATAMPLRLAITSHRQVVRGAFTFELVNMLGTELMRAPFPRG